MQVSSALDLLMEISWPAIKEAFFAIGSVAGFIAFFRPVVDSKHQRDIERSQRILDLLPEQQIIDLEPSLYQSRLVPEWMFQPFDQLAHEARTNQDSVRFSGPMSKHLRRELLGILDAYRQLRSLVQVPQWEPRSREDDDGTKGYYWDFNKEAFQDERGIPSNYAQHLDQCVDYARSIARAYQRFQITAETHLLEVPFARWLLPYRYRTHDVSQI
jgi:hypothetical protein